MTAFRVADLYSLDGLPAHIAARVTVDQQSGCWVAGPPHDRDGYGRLGSRMLHRVVYEEMTGQQIPGGHQLDHVKRWGCVWRCCVWPIHLEPVTPRENWQRIGHLAGVAAINAAKTHCGACGAELDMYNTYWKPGGGRDCRVCIRRRVREYKQRQRAEASPSLAAAA